jgi:hypothetical protein
MSFLRRKKSAATPPPPPTPVLEEVAAQQYALKLNFLARSSDGLRLPADPASRAILPSVLEPLAKTPLEVLEPLAHDYAEAAPNPERLHEMQQWVLARGAVGPIGRHALYVLESTDAVDMTVDTLVCALLHGEVDTSGYPDYAAIVGGLASHWDELSGDLIVRAVVGWGGRGMRGDTERIGGRLLSSLYQQVLATGLVLGAAAASGRPATVGERGGPICQHCGFEAAAGGFYCPKCGMRMGR